MEIPYRAAKFKSANMFVMAIWNPTVSSAARTQDVQYLEGNGRLGFSSKKYIGY